MKVLLLSCCLLLFGCEAQNKNETTLSELTLSPLGKAPLFETKDLYEGKVSIVNFWASWCVPCRAEHPLLMKLAREKNRTYRLFGVAYRDKPENAKRFLGQLGNPFDFVGLDSTGFAVLGWGIRGIPETFILDGEGNILFHHRGPLTDLAAIEQVIKQIEGRP